MTDSKADELIAAIKSLEGELKCLRRANVVNAAANICQTYKGVGYETNTKLSVANSIVDVVDYVCKANKSDDWKSSAER